MPGNDSYTVSLLHMDGANNGTTFNDNANAGSHVWTPRGTAKTSTGQSVFGGSSLLVNGSSDWIDTPTSTDFSFGTGNFTIDFWIMFTSTSAQQGIIGSYVDSNNLFQIYFFGNAGVGYNYRWQMYWKCGGTGVCQYMFSSDQANPGTSSWYHLAFVRNGSNAYIFLNGVSMPLTTVTAFGTIAAINAIYSVGMCYNQAGSKVYASAYIDEVRISKGIARWTANFTPPVQAYNAVQMVIGGTWRYIQDNIVDIGGGVGSNDSYTVALLHMSGSNGATGVADNAVGGTGGHAWTAYNKAQVYTSTYPPFANSAFGFSGPTGGTNATGSDYLQATWTNDFDFGTGNFTIDFWVNHKALPTTVAGYTAAIYIGWCSPNNYERLSCYIYNSSGIYSLYFSGNRNSGTNFASYHVAWTPTLGAWYHLAFVRNGSNFYIFINGVSQTLTVDTAISTNSVTPVTASPPMLIGTWQYANYTTDAFNGYMSEVRISKGIARWTANFSVPTQAYSSGSNLKNINMMQLDIGGVWKDLV